jgi:hypothetical protein
MIAIVVPEWAIFVGMGMWGISIVLSVTALWAEWPR